VVSTVATLLAPPRGVDVWTLSLHYAGQPAARLTGVCSAAERARAAGMPLAARRREFLLARGIVRTILAAYVGVEPGALRLGTGPHGKPFVDAPAAPGFSVSHSHGRLVVAVTAGFAVGIDLERVDRRIEIGVVARRFLPSDEAASLAALPPDARTAAFFRLWTRREAQLKARGSGFALGVGEAFAPLRHSAAAALAGPYTLVDLDLVPGYAGALAYGAPPMPLHTPNRALARL
jgi:4'-phosphopantetheinyl transferase